MKDKTRKPPTEESKAEQKHAEFADRVAQAMVDGLNAHLAREEERPEDATEDSENPIIGPEKRGQKSPTGS